MFCATHMPARHLPAIALAAGEAGGSRAAPRPSPARDGQARPRRVGTGWAGRSELGSSNNLTTYLNILLFLSKNSTFDVHLPKQSMQ